MTRVSISLWGSPFWYGDLGIPVLVWGSLNRFGDSITAHPHFALGIPVLVWGFGDPHFGLGITESVWGFTRFASPFCFGDPRFGMIIWGSLFWFGDPRIGSPYKFGYPQTDMGIPKVKWFLPVRIDSHSIQQCELFFIYRFKPFKTAPSFCSRFNSFSHSLVH